MPATIGTTEFIPNKNFDMNIVRDVTVMRRKLA
jgi:hypothetical protein